MNRGYPNYHLTLKCFGLAYPLCREASNSFLTDVFDLAKSSLGEQYLSIRSSVTYALTRAFGARALEWATESVSFIPSTAVTELEHRRFIAALSDAASGVKINNLMFPIQELSDLCRRNRTVQEIVQEALRPHNVKLAAVL
ncbi:hypothetical protein K2173_027539 [Erythroxylum novogranatense]|uniref:Uncharacterized protein n=1 Tax=Erythroxylum novogranatense TaxID=1862640 RepID=A0AAV8TZB7_9ROSI|nr:hypothetical protein K2173_027539 [Erythroxylum novogranatense]